jgi:hypothetical protein
LRLKFAGADAAAWRFANEAVAVNVLASKANTTTRTVTASPHRLGRVEDRFVPSIALGLELSVGHEAQGGRIDAVAQATVFWRPIIEDMTEVTLAVA